MIVKRRARLGIVLGMTAILLSALAVGASLLLPSPSAVSVDPTIRISLDTYTNATLATSSGLNTLQVKTGSLVLNDVSLNFVRSPSAWPAINVSVIAIGTLFASLVSHVSVTIPSGATLNATVSGLSATRQYTAWLDGANLAEVPEGNTSLSFPLLTGPSVHVLQVRSRPAPGVYLGIAFDVVYVFAFIAMLILAVAGAWAVKKKLE